MKTLRQAAQALCDRWDTPLWKDVAPTAVFIGELRTAIKQEEAQTVEPAGEVGCDDWCQHPNMGTIAFLPKALPTGTKLFAHPAPATEQSVEPELDEQAIFEGWIEHNRPSGDADAVQRAWLESGTYADLIDATTPAPATEPAKPSAEKRKELVDGLREAADMLAADAQWGKLCDPAILHANLLRGLPAQLSKEQLLHLLGTDAPAELAQQVAVPQGYTLVPDDPTPEMVQACDAKFVPRIALPFFVAAYKTMLAAAPQPPQGETK